VLTAPVRLRQEGNARHGSFYDMALGAADAVDAVEWMLAVFYCRRWIIFTLLARMRMRMAGMDPRRFSQPITTDLIALSFASWLYFSSYFNLPSFCFSFTAQHFDYVAAFLHHNTHKYL